MKAILKDAGKRILFVLLGSTAVAAFIFLLFLAGELLMAIGKFVNARIFHFKYFDEGGEFIFGALTLLMLVCTYHVGKLIYTEGFKK
jgi:hypothetical protein